jgi:hypothetical protein
MKEEHRRIALVVIAVGGWLGALGIAVWAVANFNPQHGRFAPQWVTLSIIILMGSAIAAGVAAGRMNSVRALTKVFNAGMLVGQEVDGKRDGEDDE